MTAEDTRRGEKKKKFFKTVKRWSLLVPPLVGLAVGITRSAPAPQFSQEPGNNRPGNSGQMTSGDMLGQSRVKAEKATANNTGSQIYKDEKIENLTPKPVARRGRANTTLIRQELERSGKKSRALRMSGQVDVNLTPQKDQTFKRVFTAQHGQSRIEKTTAPKLSSQENKKKTQLEAITALINIIDNIGANKEAVMLGSALKLIQNVPQNERSALLDGIQQQAIETITQTVLQTTNPLDLLKIAQLDSSGVPGLSALFDNLNSDQKAGIQLLGEEISTVFEKGTASGEELLDDVMGSLKSFWNEYGDEITVGAFAGVSGILLGSITIQVIQTVKGMRLGKKRHIERKQIIRTVILAIVAIALAACSVLGPGSNLTGTPTGETTKTLEPPPSATATTVSQLIESQATIVAPSNPVYESPFFPELNYGEVSGTPYGAIPATDVVKNNKGYLLPDNQIESRHNYIYKKGEENILRGIGLDQQYLIDVLNASDLKNGEFLGHMPDGTEVRFTNGFWQYDKNGKTYYLLSNIANIVGRTLGFPLLVTDEATEKKLFFGIVDQNGNLLDGQKFNPAFMSIEDLAKNLGYKGDTSLIGSFRYDIHGNIEILGLDGKTVLASILYLDPYVTIATATAKSTETPTLAFAPMEISAEEKSGINDYVQCDYERDFATGRLLAAEKQALADGKIVINKLAQSDGWMKKTVTYKPAIGKIEPVQPIFTGYYEPYQTASICIMDGGFMGDQYKGQKFALMGFAVKNPDGSIRFLHGAYSVNGISSFFELFKPNKDRLTLNGFMTDDLISEWGKGNFWYAAPLYEFQGGSEGKLRALTNELVETGVVTPEMEKAIFFFTLEH